MGRLQLVVAVAHERERRAAFDPPADETQHVERRFIRIVEVLEHHDCRRVQLELVQQLGRDLVRPDFPLHELRELSARQLGDVEQRSEGSRHEERIT